MRNDGLVGQNTKTIRAQKGDWQKEGAGAVRQMIEWWTVKAKVSKDQARVLNEYFAENPEVPMIITIGERQIYADYKGVKKARGGEG